MHECYVISFPDAFHGFLTWRSSYFVMHFHISYRQKLRGNRIGILFFTLRTRENNEKLKLLSTDKTYVYSLLVTFYVHVCINQKKGNFCVQYFVFWFIQILKFCKSLSYSPFRQKKLGRQMWLDFRQLTKSFAESFLRDLIPKSIFTGYYRVLFSFSISNLTCCICANKIYISNWFIAIWHMPLYCHIAIFYLKCC